MRQVITSADFHPESCSVFAFSSSKGCIRLADMRESALCDGHSKAFEETEPQARCRIRILLLHLLRFRRCPIEGYIVPKSCQIPFRSLCAVEIFWADDGCI